MKEAMKWQICGILVASKRETSAYKIAKTINVTETTVRRYINQLRSEGYPICSTQKGYYFSYKIEDITSTIDFLTNRLETQIKAIKGLRDLLTRCDK